MNSTAAQSHSRTVALTDCLIQQGALDQEQATSLREPFQQYFDEVGDADRSYSPLTVN